MNPNEFLAEFAKGGTLSPAQLHQREMAAKSPRRQQRINRRIDRELDRGVIAPLQLGGHTVFAQRPVTIQERNSGDFRAAARRGYRRRRTAVAAAAGLTGAVLLAEGAAMRRL